MARTKKSESVPVRIRFKELKNGNKSIYLDIYVNGKRSYEFLKLFLVPENIPGAKERNEHTLQAANAVKAQRILDIANKKPDVAVNAKANVTLIDWLEEYKTMRMKLGRNSVDGGVNSLVGHLKKYDAKVKLCEVDKDFIEGFIAFLQRVRIKGDKTVLSKRTICKHCETIRAALNVAVDHEILTRNPVMMYNWASIEGRESVRREYLTAEEVQRLMNTPCKRNDVKRCFLFACFCGLRLSDVRSLLWKDIVEENGRMHIELTQTKTSTALYLPLSRQAQSYLPPRSGNSDDNVFSMCSDVWINKSLADWAAAAGIAKHVTFHVGRHTFATMTLTMGSDIYTTSQLLGHSNVGVTQIYGKIIDKKKTEAAYLIDKLFEEE